ncbi:hypothetical protein BCR33DRAFT_716766 [Rhizoclosmatium globosum]|uniref:Uncharacterized protein n=1 Tax=Rhizoclosmatium globosum TaxID=329046 RepID=A0A1Y2CCQ2_9FUNG|nr:hypothetical protein BCR33DRAFT_716766 [Rhizoclosmatium globosum]|eukprot:ORY44818.1 hypothetical protein BCR33DRAFT_716766 [Rhizoclosmatium globosum]
MDIVFSERNSMRIPISLIALMSVSALPTTTLPHGPLGVSVSLASQNPDIFDYCGVCEPYLLSSNITVPQTTVNVQRLTECITSGFDFQDECQGGTRPIHVLPGSRVFLQIEYNVKIANKTQFVLRYLLPPTVKDAIFPWNDTQISPQFYPADYRSGFVYNVSIWPNVSAVGIGAKNWLYPDGHYQLGYFTFGLTQQPTDFIFQVIRNVTIDASRQDWIVLPSATATLAVTSTPTPSPAPTDNNVTYLLIIACLLGATIIFMVAGFLYSRYRKKKRAEEAASQSPPSFFGNNPIIPDLNNDDASDRESMVVFKKSGHGTYTPSMVSSSAVGSSIGLKGILKSRKEVENEVLEAQMYDTVVLKLQQRRSMPDAQASVTGENTWLENTSEASSGGRVGGGSGNGKRVMFKPMVEMAIVDLSKPPALNAIPNGLFDDSDEEDAEEEDSTGFVDYHDGGIEKGMKGILGKKVEIEDDEIESDKKELEDGDDSSGDDDDWRKGE